MVLEELVLKNFRNYEHLALVPGSGTNVFYGANAQGKTNMLEAVFVLSRGGSQRAERDAEMIRWGSDSFLVKGRVGAGPRPLEIEVVFSEEKGKTVRVNGLPKRLVEYLSPEVKVVLFVPDDLQMVKGPASLRRRFIDQEISQVDPAYASGLSRYNKVLAQRNALLRSGASPRDPGVEVWTEQLIEYGTKLCRKRLATLRKICPAARAIHSRFAEGEILDVTYRPSIPIAGDETDEEIQGVFGKRLQERAEEEQERGMTLVGPHRDDISFDIDGSDARHFGSQGQQRSIVVSMKVAELEYLRNETGYSPILLLDDILSELDASRRHGLLNTITRDVQVLLTCTDYSPFESELPIPTRYFRVSSGMLETDAGG